jgi:hypothetical protein
MVKHQSSGSQVQQQHGIVAGTARVAMQISTRYPSVRFKSRVSWARVTAAR